MTYYKITDFKINANKTGQKDHFLFTTLTQETNPKLGYFLIGFTSELNQNLSEKIAALLYDAANYYFTYENGLLSPEKSFEETIKLFNQKFYQHIAEHHSYSKKINITIAILVDGNLHFVNYGNNAIWLTTSTHKIINLIKSLGADTTLAGEKIFNQIFSGNITKYKRLALTNNNISAAIGANELQKILTRLPIGSIEHQLQIKLAERSPKNNQAIIGTIIDFSPTAHTATTPAKVPPEQSLHNLFKLTNQTKKFLQPKIMPDFNKLIQIWHAIKPKQPKKSLSFKRIQKRFPPFSFAKLKINKNKIKDISKLPQKIKMPSTKKSLRLPAPKNLLTEIRFHTKRWSTAFKSLPRSSKILLVLALLLLITFSLSIRFINTKKTTSISTTYLEDITQQIKDLHDKTEAAIIYGNNKDARKYLDQSLNLIQQIPDNNKKRKELKDSLMAKYDNLYQRLNKISKIPSPFLFLDLQTFNQQINSQQITNLNNSLLVLSKSSLLQININDQSIEDKTKDISSNPDFNFIAVSGNDVAIVNQNNNLLLYNPNEKELLTSQTISTANQNIAAIASYNRRLYLLDKGNGQIWRLNRQGNNFSPPRAWLKEEVSNNEGWRDFNIDGTIYILNNGNIEQYSQGRRTEFAIEEITPNLTNATKIKTLPDIPYIYILDPTNQRLVIFDKDGKLVKQYTSNSFTDLKDFAINYKAEDNKTNVYLLNGNKIYLIAIDE